MKLVNSRFCRPSGALVVVTVVTPGLAPLGYSHSSLRDGNGQTSGWNRIGVNSVSPYCRSFTYPCLTYGLLGRRSFQGREESHDRTLDNAQWPP